jgi:hypothetical protein
MRQILIGNSFPLSLIRRKVTIAPATLNLEGLEEIYSFWGHENTIQVASDFLGIDLTPKVKRPEIKLNPNNLPELDGVIFTECWIVSPTYKVGFRPAIGEEVEESVIKSWQVLKITWEN